MGGVVPSLLLYAFMPCTGTTIRFLVFYKRSYTETFWKTNKETKLRIHNITAKAALKFGSEAWVLKKREEQRLEAAQMKFLRHLE